MASQPPLEPASLSEGVRALAYACTGSSAETAAVSSVFERAASDGAHAVLFRRWWQEKTLHPLPADAVVMPWVAEVHQQIADQLADWNLLGEQPLLLACRGCGRIFTTTPPRFARSCGRCKPYQPSAKPNPGGGRVMHTTGVYASGPAGPQQGQSLLCDHPDCFTLFLAPSGQHRYCDTHRKDRKATARSRKQQAPPKHRRVRFHPSTNESVTFSFTAADGQSTELTITADGYQPQTNNELLQLLQLLPTGLLTLHHTA